jgi:hypothetical protein
VSETTPRCVPFATETAGEAKPVKKRGVLPRSARNYFFTTNYLARKRRHFFKFPRCAAAVFFSSMTSYDGLSAPRERPLNRVATAFSNPHVTGMHRTGRRHSWTTGFAVSTDYVL